MPAVQHFVQALQERDRFQIFAAAERVRNPFAGLARIIEVEHGSHGIHAQAVDVIFVQPEKRVREQKILHFVAAVVEDQRAPVGMRALARIGVLVEMRAVEESPGRARRAGNAPESNRGSRRCPSWWQRSTKYMKSAGEPKRLVTAK